MALLRFCQLSFAYPNAAVRALDKVDLELREGEYLVLAGPSGCGKTTLLRHAKPELVPAGAIEGQVLYREQPLAELDPFCAATRIGFVQQNPDNQIVTDYVWHELAFGLENLGLPTAAIRRRVAEMAAFFGMETWFRSKTTEISGGQKQLLNLASVLAMDPELLILDEPTAMLDPLAARALLDAVRRVNKELGVTVLLTEHRLEEVFPVADRVAMMDGGRLAALGRPQQIARLLTDKADRHQLYFGLPAAARIFSELGATGDMPLTVRDGRAVVKEMLGPVEKEEEMQPHRHLSGRRKDGKEGKNGKSDFSKEKPVLQADEVWFRYGEEGPDVLRGLDLRLYPGERLCLLGGNGAGKTTLLSLLAESKKPYRGKVRRAPGVKLCMLPQNPRSLFTFDSLGRELLESADGDQERADAMAERLGLTGLLDRHPYDLSGGEAQRAAVGKLLLRQANVLLLDEPTKGLDAYAKKNLAELLVRLSEEGTSLLTVTHDIEFAAEHMQRCAFIFDGLVISEGEPHQFFTGNRFYTTAAQLIAGEYFPQAITCGEVIAACQSCLSAAAPRPPLG
ncbi:MAG: ATP-binding cassette domain-containing protein [Firmicutes bacterium]|nr:ATP-binding cassette domain-containing protein [Bacillota bacterium]